MINIDGEQCQKKIKRSLKYDLLCEAQRTRQEAEFPRISYGLYSHVNTLPAARVYPN